MKYYYKYFIGFLILFINQLVVAEPGLNTNRSLAAFGYKNLEKLIPTEKLQILSQENFAIKNRIAVKLAGLGRVEINFEKQKSPKIIPTVVNAKGKYKDYKGITLLGGTAQVRGQKLPMAASIYQDNGVATLHSSFVIQTKSNRKPIKYHLAIPLEGEEQGVVRVDRSGKESANSKLCQALTANHDHQVSASKGIQAQKTSASSTYVFEVSLYGDKAWKNTHGDSANSVITSAINEVEEDIYTPQLNIEIDIVQQSILGTRTFGTKNGDGTYDADDMLIDFQGEIQAAGDYDNADAIHLFSGETMANGVIGLAYVGVICNSLANSFGLTQWTSAASTPITLAHEWGHNFGAEHDSSTPQTIMFPSLNSSKSFSDFSKGQVNTHLASYANLCMAPGSGSSSSGSSGSTSTGGDSTSGDGGSSSSGSDDSSGDSGDSSGSGSSGTTGGVGSEPGDAKALDLTMTSSLNTTTGELSIDGSVTYNGAAYTDENCTAYVRIGTKKNAVSYATAVYSQALTSSTVSISTTIQKRSKNRNPKNNKKYKYWSAFTVSCDGGSGGETSSRLKLDSLKIKSKRVKPKALIKHIKNLLK